MKKIAIFVAILVLTGLTACNKATNSAAHDKFVQMCKDDPRAKQQGFNCSCQADIIDAVLMTNEMDELVNFLEVEKKDQAQALQLGKDPKYTPMFQKIAGIGLAIHDKCGKSGEASGTPAAASAPTQAAITAPSPAATPTKPAKK